MAAFTDGDPVRVTQPAACTHGFPARHVLLVDQTRKHAGDRYGDVEGPESIEHLDSMRRLRDTYAEGEAEGRFVLAFVHADMCRTES